MNISIKRGLTVPLLGAPEQVIRDAHPVTKVALMGSDLMGIRAEMLVAEGDDCVHGAPLFRDRKRPEIVFTAPVSGRIEEVRLGAKRRLEVLVISRTGDDSTHFDVPNVPDRTAARKLILESGLWPCLRTRPFARIPDPGSAPQAVGQRPHGHAQRHGRAGAAGPGGARPGPVCRGRVRVSGAQWFVDQGALA